MAERLEWDNVSLMLRPIRIAQLVVTGEHWRFEIPLGERGTFESTGYENGGDCMQDAESESEVRRLLKEAGVDCG